MAIDYILETEGLSKEFKGFAAVSDVSLRVRRHSIHALIGPNGAGKTTCFNLITQFIPASAGTIVYNGRNIVGSDPATVATLGMVRSFQISAVFPYMTALENVRVALQRHLRSSFHFWRSEVSLRRLHDRAHALLESVDLGEYADSYAVELSYGRKRALEIATTLALEPEMLLLDEPMAGLAHEDIHRVIELIRSVAQNRTVLMVEHNMTVVAALSDTITVLQRGEILVEGPYDQVSTDPRVIEAYVGTGHA
jgi:branched-chain amino acid transport system ATP-binding protein